MVNKLIKILTISLFCFLKFLSCAAWEPAITIRVGVDTWLQIIIKDGNLYFSGDQRGVSTHPDLKRWHGYYFTSPTAYITFFNNKKTIWNMHDPLQLEEYIAHSNFEIKSVELLASGVVRFLFIRL